MFRGPDGRSASWLPPSGRERPGAQSCEGATELGFPGATLGQMLGEAARRAGEPSGQGEEASPEGLGGLLPHRTMLPKRALHVMTPSGEAWRVS